MEENGSFSQHIDVSKADPTPTPTPTPGSTHHATTTPSTPGAPAPGATPSPNNPQALAATGTDDSTLLVGIAAPTVAVVGTALLMAGRRRTSRH
ncbi:LPXTG cell wall anchor domain-containing protein [Streptomyces sp. NPDC002769]|uniref:LPXTG cell wall anchor domain-containing protein n=1 Tax=Streptomyces sp. NPDC002769 TaxID=3154542 RepID=UPI0033267DD6